MCLAIPGKIIEVYGDTAKVDFGEGTARLVNISLVNGKVGYYVIVHAGFAIEILDEEEAKKSLEAWEELLKIDENLARK